MSATQRFDAEVFDAYAFRAAMGHFASGITIVSGFDGESPHGFTCQSFYSVSVDPPLVSFSVMVESTSYPHIRETGKFSINVLSHAQEHVSNQFARRGEDKWVGVDWQHSRHGNPILAGTLMWLDCSLEAEHTVGDHHIVIGRVLETSPADWHQGEPLVYFKGSYRHLRGLDPLPEISD